MKAEFEPGRGLQDSNKTHLQKEVINVQDINEVRRVWKEKCSAFELNMTEIIEMTDE